VSRGKKRTEHNDLKLTKSFLFYGTPRVFNTPSATELSLQEGIFLPQNPN